MSKSNGTKAISQLVSLLLCILLVQTAFAVGNATNEITIIGNATNENTTIENATVNSIYPSYYSTSLNAGNSSQFTVSFTNGGNETLFLTPKVVAMPYSTTSMNESWITISPTNATVAPGSVQNFNVEINVPWDEGDGYDGQIAFTDDQVPNSTNYVNSMQFWVYVYPQSKIELQTNSISDTVEAGKEYEYKVKIKNVASRDFTIHPTLNNISGYQQAFGNDTIELSAPSTIKAGEITDMTIKVHAPENATGTYNGHIDMNVNGKVNDWSVPSLNLYFNVRQQTTPYAKTFYAANNGPIKIEVSANKNNQYSTLRTSPKDKGPSFELGLTHNSIPVNMTVVKSVENGGASFSNWYYPYSTWAGDVYQNNDGRYEATYTAPGAIGDWELTIFPKSMNSFEYSITIGDNNSVVTGIVNNENAATGNTSTGNVANEVVADFSALSTTGKAPLAVKFIDKSTGSPTSWCWNFGDKSTSTAQNPVHEYTKAGKYTVSLTVKNSDINNTKTISNYITAEK
jgi:PKD repeat protein